ncbi:MAG TPA: ATP-binding cassette domain-containing protein, partial [Sporichthya sp.]|nr:ATP-binding cassette domain-containing protein [Sporichthya sp.]
GLGHRRDYSVTRISGGEKQRVAIARALVSRPAVIFADEPTGNLDSTTSGEILDLMRESVDTLTSGQVYLGDIELSSLNDKRLTQVRRDRIGFIFQTYNLIPTLTALENITLPMALAGRKPDEAWLDRVIDTVSLRPRLGHRPSELSGGQQQRVAVARALVGRPEVVFADEPTGNLDSRTSAEVLSFLRESVRRTGQTIAMVTHDPGAAAYADRVLFLADGRIVDEMYDPTADRVLERMKAFEADVPHPEVVWADHVPPAPQPAAGPGAGAGAGAPTVSSPVPLMSPLPPAPPPAPDQVAPPPPTVAANGQAPAVDGTPDAVDMASWTDADWDAWLTRKQSETDSGA